MTQIRSRATTGTFTMYTTPWCGYCHRLQSQLDREGIALRRGRHRAGPERRRGRDGRQQRQPDRADPGVRRRQRAHQPLGGARSRRSSRRSPDRRGMMPRESLPRRRRLAGPHRAAHACVGRRPPTPRPPGLPQRPGGRRVADPAADRPCGVRRVVRHAGACTSHAGRRARRRGRRRAARSRQGRVGPGEVDDQAEASRPRSAGCSHLRTRPGYGPRRLAALWRSASTSSACDASTAGCFADNEPSWRLWSARHAARVPPPRRLHRTRGWLDGSDVRDARR